MANMNMILGPYICPNWLHLSMNIKHTNKNIWRNMYWLVITIITRWNQILQKSSFCFFGFWWGFYWLIELPLLASFSDQKRHVTNLFSHITLFVTSHLFFFYVSSSHIFLWRSWWPPFLIILFLDLEPTLIDVCWWKCVLRCVQTKRKIFELLAVIGFLRL